MAQGAGMDQHLWPCDRPGKAGEAIWIVGEAKHNLTEKEVKKFIGKVVRVKRHLEGQVFPVCFCYRVRPEVQQMIGGAGIRSVFSYYEQIIDAYAGLPMSCS